MAELDGVNCCMKVVVVIDRCRVFVRDECGTPDVEELVDGIVRECCCGIKDLRELKPRM